MEIPAFIPFHPKDRRYLPYCIDSIRRHVRPQVARIVVMAGPLPSTLERQLHRLDVSLLSEAQVWRDSGLEHWPSFRTASGDSSGWMLQQFLKWEARRYTDADRYLVVDADTIFVRRTELMEQTRGVLFERPGCHQPYLETYERLLGERPSRDCSFITHFQLLDRVILESLLQTIRSRSGQGSWFEAVRTGCESAGPQGFSEYETYGHFATEHYRERVTTRANENKGSRWYLPTVRLQLVLARILGVGSLSFHGYQQRPRFRRRPRVARP
jgi:hypothetical protein